MKRYLIALGAMLAATLSLTNCTEEFQTGPDPVGTTYTIYANAADTKTVNDGFSTKWSDYDSLNVFHVESGSAWMSDNIKFTILDVEEGEFIAEGFDESALSEVNDWYVLYPYNPYVISPSALDESGYFALGGRVGRPQVQYGNDNMDHIGGNNYPMWAVAKELPVTVIPEVMMTHLTSLVEVVVANNSEVPMTVTSISFDAPENITGTYYIGIDEEEPYFVSSGDAYVSDVVRLTVKDGEPIEPGSSAKFYFAIKPFTAPAGETLSLSVNSIVKTFELTQDVVFSPGKVKTLNFNVDEYYAPEPGPYSSNMLWALGKNAYTEKAIVNDVENVSVLKLGKNDAFGSAVITIPAGTSKIGFYAVSWSGSAATLSLLKDSEVIGEVYPPVNEGASGNSPYYIDEEDAVCYFEIPVNAVEESDYVLETSVNKRVLIWGLNYYTADGDLGENQEPEKPEVQAVTVAEFLAAAEDKTVYELTGLITSVTNTTYGNFYLKDETGEVYIYGLVDENGRYIFTETKLKAGDTITVRGTRRSYGDKPEMIDALYVSHEVGEEIVPEPEPEPSEPVVATVAEVLAAEVSTTVWYQMTGKVTNIANTIYGNFDLIDETGSIYVYGLTATKVEKNDKSFASLGIQEGDIVTIIGKRAEYKGSPQVGGAYYVSHEVTKELQITQEVVFQDGLNTDYSGVPVRFDVKSVTEFFGITESELYFAMGTCDGGNQVGNTIEFGVCYQENEDWVYSDEAYTTNIFGYYVNKEGRPVLWGSDDSFLFAESSYWWWGEDSYEAAKEESYGFEMLDFNVGFRPEHYDGKPGDEYSFTYYLRDPASMKTCRLRFLVKITEYVDVEKGMYPDTPTAGTFDVDVPLSFSLSALNYDYDGVFFYEPFETVKEKLGMTAYELHKAISSGDVSCTYTLPDGTTDSGTFVWLNADNGLTSWGAKDTAIDIEWFHGTSPESLYGHTCAMPSYDKSGRFYFADAVKAAIGKPLKVTFTISKGDTVVNLHCTTTLAE